MAAGSTARRRFWRQGTSPCTAAEAFPKAGATRIPHGPMPASCDIIPSRMASARNLVAIVLVFPLLGQQLPIRPYTTADGLANNHVKHIRSDSRGFLWLCTDEGLSRFDGQSFTNYTTRDG